MKIRRVTSSLCRSVAGLLSFFVTLYGVYSFEFANFRRDTLVMGLYCLFPLLSFPTFLASFRSLRWSVRMHWILAAGYLAVYSVLDWRTCSERGYCHGVIQTVLQTLTAGVVQAVFAVAVLNLAALLLRGRVRTAEEKRNAIHPSY